MNIRYPIYEGVYRILTGGLAPRLPSGKPFFLFTAPSAMTKTDYP